MMGWKPEEATLPFIYRQIVKDDRNMVTEATEFALNVCREHPEIRPLETTFEVDFRMRKPDGSEVRMMRKSCVFKKDKMGFPFLLLSVYTDISSFKSDDSIVIAAEGPDKHLFHYQRKDQIRPKNGKFTEKEILILKGLSEGKCCKIIAEEMDIKLCTVNSYCRNMLRKNNQSKINGVLALAINKGNLVLKDQKSIKFQN